MASRADPDANGGVKLSGRRIAIAISAGAAIAALCFTRAFTTMAHNVAAAITAPHLSFANWAGDAARSAGAVFRAPAVERENAELRRRVEQLTAENMIYSLQTGSARSADALPSFGIAADVLSSGGSDGWGRIIRISKGTRDGVRTGAAVVATVKQPGPDSGFPAVALVGRVTEAKAGTSTVLLITDVNSRVACRFSPDIPSARGILIGGGLNTSAGPELPLLHTIEPLQLEYLKKDLPPIDGAKLITSGQGGEFPRGLPIGVVVSSDTDSSGLYQRANVMPYIDFSQLRIVTVLGIDSQKQPDDEAGQ